MKRYFTWLLLSLLVSTAVAQSNENEITLEEVLGLAYEKSLAAFKAKNIYLASYWEYKSFKAKRLPQATVQLRPFTYNRSVQKRYDFERNIDVYRETQILDSYANLELTQHLGLTGGNFYINSDFGRLQNYGTGEVTTFSATPIRVGFYQPLLAHNPLKWEKEIAPLKFEKAKQEYLQDQQDIYLRAVEYFFDLVLANMKWEMAQHDLATSDTLYAIGQKRFAIAAIEKEDLLNLELRKFNAGIALTQAQKNLSKARFNLNSYLGFDENIVFTPVLPSIPEGLSIDENEAIAYALDYNPDFLNFRHRILESQRSLDRTIKENRVDLSLAASYGLNGQSSYWETVYQQPLDQQMVALNMTIPILDWGERKGQRQMAERNHEVVEIEVKQAEIDFRQQVALKVIDFNLQESLVKNSHKATEISEESFELTKKRFLLGISDVLTLNTAMNARQAAMENYIMSVHAYWRYYYEVQQLSLYNFMEGRPLAEDFNKIIAE